MQEVIQAEEVAWMKALSPETYKPGHADELGQCGWAWAVARAGQDMR